MARLSFSRAVSSIVILACARSICASSFLSRAQEANVKELTPELEASILQEIENVLGNSGRGMTESRLTRIEDMLRTTFQALPKNQQGRIQHVAVRYALHSYFVQRHAWYVRGLSSLGEENNGVSPTSILQDKVEEFVQGAFEQRLGARGLDLKDMAVLAATYENLVHKEMMQRLDATLHVMGMTGEESMTSAKVDEVVDVYMMGYILNLNYTVVEQSQLQTVKTSMMEIYPSWPGTQTFLRGVQADVAGSSHKHYFTRADVVDILEAVFDQYGRWQDKECQYLKAQLSALEDRSIGVNGSGRVRLSAFYGSALRDGNWQFSESAAYLQQNGALDTHGADRVIIANYVNSPSNCLASSKYYSVCCINECEDIMDHVEHRFAAPVAAPAEIAEFIASLPSSSVAAPRELHPLLTKRLEDIAHRYDGRVPLHGRLFAQWLHHAYPRECPYPHLSGTTKPQTVEDYMKQGQGVPVASKDEMVVVVEAAGPHEGESGGDECTEWSHHEELYVGDHGFAARTSPSQGGAWQALRPFAYLAAVLATAFTLLRRTAVSCTKAGAKKTYGLAERKDLYV